MSDRTATVYDYRALVRRLVEIADNPSATERLVDYDRVARAHEPNIVDYETGDDGVVRPTERKRDE